MSLAWASHVPSKTPSLICMGLRPLCVSGPPPQVVEEGGEHREYSVGSFTASTRLSAPQLLMSQEDFLEVVSHFSVSLPCYVWRSSCVAHLLCGRCRASGMTHLDQVRPEDSEREMVEEQLFEGDGACFASSFVTQPKTLV